MKLTVKQILCIKLVKYYINILRYTISKTSKVSSVHPMEAYGGSRGIALLVPNLDARWGWVVVIMPR